jgi:hypothetical protein
VLLMLAMTSSGRELVPTRGRVAAEVGTGLAIDLLSVAMPFLGTAAAGLKGLAELQRQQLEWTAVLLTLKDKAEPPRPPRRSSVAVGQKCHTLSAKHRAHSCSSPVPPASRG